MSPVPAPTEPMGILPSNSNRANASPATSFSSRLFKSLLQHPRSSGAAKHRHTGDANKYRQGKALLGARGWHPSRHRVPPSQPWALSCPVLAALPCTAGATSLCAVPAICGKCAAEVRHGLENDKLLRFMHCVGPWGYHGGYSPTCSPTESTRSKPRCRNHTQGFCGS